MKSISNKYTLTFLGTGTSQGVPVVASNHPVSFSKNKKDKRLRSSVLLEIENKNIVIDCGPDFRYQTLREDVQHVDAIFITHEHSDHITGIDDIRPFYFKLGKKMPFFCKKQVAESIKERFPYFFYENRYPGVPELDINEIENEDFFFENIKITPIKLMHANMEIVGFRIKKMVYMTDVNYIPEEEYGKLTNVDTLIINALRHEKHHSHFNLEQALEVIKKIKPKKAYLTHLSQHLGFHDELEKKLPENVFLAYDGLKIDF